MSIAAYKATIRQSETPRQIERRILSRLTGALEAHGAFDKAEETAERLAILSAGLREALAENQKFWSALRLDLAHPSNELSPELRAGLVSITFWVERRTNEVLGGKPGVLALAGINRTIINGLSGTPVTATPAPVQAARPVAALQQGR